MRCLLAAALLAPFWTGAASAGMQVAPLIIELADAPGTSGSFQVKNTSTADLPVEVTVMHREIGPDGNTINVPADGDFVIFPPQMLIPGLETQVFRFQYLGNPDAAKSQSYYIFATQLPVDLDATADTKGVSARISFLYEYGVAVHMVPHGAKPNMVVLQAKPKARADGSPGVALTIRNDGNRFARASEHELTVRYNGGSQTFGRDVLKAGLDNGMWLPGQTFEIDFPLAKMPSGEVTASFRYVAE